jgi:hypothetical protein
MSTNADHHAAVSDTNSKNSEAGFKAAMEDFERSLMHPILAGELATWTEELQEAWNEFAAQIHFRSKHLYPRQYREIGEQDPELLPRLDLLGAEDAAIEQRREKINQAITQATQHIPELEPDEQKAQRHLQTLIDDGIDFVNRVRKQSIAIETWYVEAFDRDRGAVD